MKVAAVEAVLAKANAKPGYTIKIANRSQENVQVEIREEGGHLCWRAWNFETDFEYDLMKNIERYTN